MLRRIVLVLLFLSPSLVFAGQSIHVTAYSAVLMNPDSKRVIYSKNQHVKLAPASTVKIMTAIVVLNKSNLDKNVRISALAASMPPSKIHARKGEVYKTGDLLKALLLNSGNDASVALSESVAGTEEKFADMMNEAARKIGARNTRFKTSNGLPSVNQYSTAYDLALIMREATRYKAIMDIIGLKNADIKELTGGRVIKLRNHNKFLWKDKPYIMLGKTGYTINARHCFAGYIEYSNKKKAVVVILRSRKMWADLHNLALKARNMR